MRTYGPSREADTADMHSRQWAPSGDEVRSIPFRRPACILAHDGQGYGPVVRPVSGIRLRTGADVPTALAEDGLLVVLEGVVAQCAWTSPGKRRITGLLVEGDLSCSLLSSAPDGEWFAALTPCRVTVLPWHEADRIIHADPSAGPALWQVALRWVSIQREWLRNDARPSLERLGHRICEVMTRAGIILDHPVGVYLPLLRQAAWADMTAMTSVHVNRCLGRLAQAEFICMTRGRITVTDPAGLMAFAGFDASYLESGIANRDRMAASARQRGTSASGVYTATHE